MAHSRNYLNSKLSLGRLAWSLIVLCPILVGCGSDQLATHQVNGSIRFEDGSIPKFGQVEFYNSEHEINARGNINRDGTFTVGTYEDADGAVEGTHEVVIIQLSGDHMTSQLSEKINHDHGDLISRKYIDYRTSDLQCEIAAGENEIELVVEKADE